MRKLRVCIESVSQIRSQSKLSLGTMCGKGPCSAMPHTQHAMHCASMASMLCEAVAAPNRLGSTEACIGVTVLQRGGPSCTRFLGQHCWPNRAGCKASWPCQSASLASFCPQRYIRGLEKLVVTSSRRSSLRHKARVLACLVSVNDRALLA